MILNRNSTTERRLERPQCLRNLSLSLRPSSSLGSFTRYVAPLGGREGTLICYVISEFILKAIVRSVTTNGGATGRLGGYSSPRRSILAPSSEGESDFFGDFLHL